MASSKLTNQVTSWIHILILMSNDGNIKDMIKSMGFSHITLYKIRKRAISQGFN